MDDTAADVPVGAAVAMAVDASASLGVGKSEGEASLLDGLELLCTPPVLWTTPVRGSGAERPLDDEVELDLAPTEFGATLDFESGEESAAEADEVGPGDDVLPAESDDEREADDDESDDELEELDLPESANATPGAFATATPMPTVTTNTPTRAIYCALTDIAFSLLRGFG